jgi:hypothetical protein
MDYNIKLLQNAFSICALPVNNHLPNWITASSFYSITKHTNELSVVCQSNIVPDNIIQDANWRLLQIDAMLDLSLTGITAKFSTALSAAGVNLCVIATYNTDYILVKQDKLQIAITALAAVGFKLIN